MMKRISTFFPVLLLFCYFPTIAQDTWPRDIPLAGGGKISIYEPQPETLKGDVVTGRAAVSVTKDASSDPQFGAIFYTATLETDKDQRTAILESIDVTAAKFADSLGTDRINELTDIIQQEVPKWNLSISLDELITSVKQQQQINDADLKTTPPVIIYTEKPSTLITIDGDPKLQNDKDLGIERVMNSPFLIVKNPSDKKFYANAGGYWYSSVSVTSGYSYAQQLPDLISKIDAQIKKSDTADANRTDQNRPKSPTAIIVATVPTELIQTEGEANYASIQGTSLLFASNTLDDIFKDINTQKSFTLLSGRWYSAANLNGPWTFTPSDQLPADFSKIPVGSEKDGVLASVAGTDEASDAVIEAQIPQVAKVDRKTATCTVTYDGDPIFQSIDNTSLRVAENSNITVMQSGDGNYYALQNGVWFISPNPKGPWQVANDRPADIDKIPPSSPAYNTKYVYVYDQTPDYVYMGYTPGYLGCYVYGPTVVYGTGWYYRPWYGHYYYPRPVTYGFGFSYNPWTGWNMSFGMSYNFGWFHFAYHTRPYYGGWFGPPAFRPPYRPWGWNGGYYGNVRRPINRPNVGYNRPAINRPMPYRPSRNIYNGSRGVVTRDINRRPGNPVNRPQPPGNIGGPGSNRPGINPPRPGPGTNPSRPGGNPPPTSRPSVLPSTRPAPVNNVVADRDGNVFRRDNQGNWQQRNQQNWKPVDNNQNRVPQLNQQQNRMDRGVQRTQNFQQYNRPAAPPRPAPVSRPAQGGGQMRRR